MLDDYDIEVRLLDDIVLTQNEQYDEDDIMDDELLLVMVMVLIDDDEVDIYDEFLIELLVRVMCRFQVQIDEVKLDIAVIDAYRQILSLFFLVQKQKYLLLLEDEDEVDDYTALEDDDELDDYLVDAVV